MNTSGLLMDGLQVAIRSAAECRGSAARAAPGSGRGEWRGGTRAQAALKDGHERVRDLRPGEALVLAIPVRDPVEGPGQRKGGHLGVARLDRPILYALADQPADAVIDLGLECL